MAPTTGGADAVELEEPGHTRPWRNKVTDEELEPLIEQGMSLTTMREHFAGLGRTISNQALSLRRKAILARRDQTGRLLPWEVAGKHAQNSSIYLAVINYAKWRKGRGLTEKQMAIVREFEQIMGELDAVMLYDRKRGFKTRSRRSEDGPSLLVER